MKTINKEELKAKLDSKHDFKLVMTLGAFHFMAKRIPGSTFLENPETAMSKLKKDAEIVVYCSDVLCVASQIAYNKLVSQGFTNVKRYSGGIVEWEEAGYPLEGEMVQ
ncbi:MAG: Thiosulfate sulfurtransferase GlpE [Candidatus Heimdallarchaeota archaeon LC_2]|nr:MAG: Thiosulfate sulfurtransferase GlpE [Candidatus Heimdallarchaeota archaeon LC_2]